jgi:hypothetical protein
MTLYNYIRRRSYDDVAFTEYDRNPNFLPMIFYLILLHAQETIKTLVLVGWISYMMELHIV